MENSLQGLALLQEGCVVYANPALEEISGYRCDELLSLNSEQVLDLVHPEDRERVSQTLQARLLGEPAPSRAQFRIVRKDGEVRWVETIVSLLEYRGRPAIRSQPAFRPHRPQSTPYASCAKMPS